MPLPWLIAGGVATAVATILLSDDPKGALKKDVEANMGKFHEDLEEMEIFILSWSLKNIGPRNMVKIALDEEGYFQKKYDTFVQNRLNDEAILKELRKIFDKLVQEQKCKEDDEFFSTSFDKMEKELQQQQEACNVIKKGYYVAKEEFVRRQKIEKQDDAKNQLEQMEKHLQEMVGFYSLWLDDLHSHSDTHLEAIIASENNTFQRKREELAQSIIEDKTILEETQIYFQTQIDLELREEAEVTFWNDLLDDMREICQQQQQQYTLIEEGCRQAAQELQQRKWKAKVKSLAIEAEAFCANWLGTENRHNITEFINDRAILKAEIANGKKKLKQYQAELNRNAQKQYRKDIYKIQQTYQGADKLYDQMNEEYKFFTKQMGICDQYEKTFISQFNELLTQVHACVAEDRKDKWRQKDDEIEAQVNELRARYDAIAANLVMCSMEIPNTSNKKTYYFLQDMRELEARQKNLKNTCESIMEQIRTTLKALEEQNVVDESHVPKYDPASGEVVYLEYDRKLNKTIIKYNGEDISSDSELYRVENMSIEEWFAEDKNWEGLPVQLADEINDDFVLQFCGSAEEYKMVEDAFAKADLDGLEYKIKWFKK